MIVKLLIEGGNMAPSPVIAQQLGPIGINIGQLISKVNEATKEFKGIKVPVELDIDPGKKNFTINIKSPPVAELIKKELGLEKGSGDHKNLKVGNIAIEQIIKIAKMKLPEMLERDLKAMVKTIVGCCVSLGVLIDNKNPIDVEREISEGRYDREIKSEKTEVDDKKKKELDRFFSDIKRKQDARLKAEEEAKAAKESKETTTKVEKDNMDKTKVKTITETKKK